jgi:hypothetical protein
MEQTNDGYFFGRNYCWLAAINDCIGLDALSGTYLIAVKLQAWHFIGLAFYRLGIPKLHA